MKRYTIAVVFLLCGAFALHGEDSPLVAAAKKSSAARAKAAAKPSTVITNATVTNSTGTLSTSGTSAAIPDYTSKTPAQSTAVAPKPATPNRGAGNFEPGYAEVAARDPRVPRMSSNTASASSTLPRESENSSQVYAPRTAANSSYSGMNPQTAKNQQAPGPAAVTNSSNQREAINAGPNRTYQP